MATLSLTLAAIYNGLSLDETARLRDERECQEAETGPAKLISQSAVQTERLIGSPPPYSVSPCVGTAFEPTFDQSENKSL